MSGLDKILEQISLEAKENSNKIIEKATLQAKELSEQSEKEAEAKASDILSLSKRQCEDIVARGHSSAQLYKRQSLLKTKQAIISQMIDKAHTHLLALSDEEYFSLILKMVKKNCQNQNGTILFNEKDLNRMSASFKAELQKVSGGSLEISSKPIDIDGGFLLSYGGIEENCSFKAVFESNEELLQDKVHSLLFE